VLLYKQQTTNKRGQNGTMVCTSDSDLACDVKASKHKLFHIETTPVPIKHDRRVSIADVIDKASTKLPRLCDDLDTEQLATATGWFATATVSNADETFEGDLLSDGLLVRNPATLSGLTAASLSVVNAPGTCTGTTSSNSSAAESDSLRAADVAALSVPLARFFSSGHPTADPTMNGAFAELATAAVKRHSAGIADARVTTTLPLGDATRNSASDTLLAYSFEHISPATVVNTATSLVVSPGGAEVGAGSGKSTYSTGMGAVAGATFTVENTGILGHAARNAFDSTVLAESILSLGVEDFAVDTTVSARTAAARHL
jgi:hypothetical protein